MTSGASVPERVICSDADQFAHEAVRRILQAADEAIRERSRFHLALSGGSTPARTYALLADPERTPSLDWSRTYFCFGDERRVPHEDPRSNYHMFSQAFAGVNIRLLHLLPIATDQPTPGESAAAYARALSALFAAPLEGAPPRFDLILLGLGDDGHTASLFPGAAALHEERAWVTWSPPGTLPPPVDRVTLTYPVLNAARQVLFLVAGANKAAPVRDVLEGGASKEQRPAAGVRPADGRVTWLLDKAAAGLLTRQ